MSDPDYRKYSEFVRVLARASGIIVSDDERTLLHEGLRHFGVRSEEGQWILLGVAADEGVGVESMLDRRIADVLGRFARSDGKLGKREFEDAVEIYREWANDGMSEDDIRKKLKKIVQQKHWKARRHGLLRSGRWFNRIKTD